MVIPNQTIAVGKATEGMAVAVDIAKLMALLVVWTAVGIFLIPTFLNKISKIKLVRADVASLNADAFD